MHIKFNVCWLINEMHIVDEEINMWMTTSRKYRSYKE